MATRVEKVRYGSPYGPLPSEQLFKEYKAEQIPPPPKIPEVPMPEWATSYLANNSTNRRWFAVQENMDWCNNSGDSPQDSRAQRRYVLAFFAGHFSPANITVSVFSATKNHISTGVAKVAKMAAVRAELTAKYKDMEVSMADFENIGIIKSIATTTVQHLQHLCVCCGSLNTMLRGSLTRNNPENVEYRHRFWFLPDPSKVPDHYTNEQKAPIGLPCNLKLEDPESGTLLIEWSDE